MGTSDGILAYGYNLGGPEEWLVREVGDNGEVTAEWWDDDDVTEAAITALRTAAGFTETDWEADGYFDRRNAADARIGVVIDTHCSGEYPEYLLAAHVTTAARGYPETLDLAELQAQAVTDGWDDKLRAALEVLGLTPTQEKPGWILASYWG